MNYMVGSPCKACKGTGRQSYYDEGHGGADYYTSTCVDCNATGKTPERRKKNVRRHNADRRALAVKQSSRRG